jgi:predicted GNAT family N-acyltransferase
MAREMKLEQTTVYRAVVRFQGPGHRGIHNGAKDFLFVFGPHIDPKVAVAAQAYIERVYKQYGYEVVETRVEELSGEWHAIGHPETPSSTG